MFLLKVEPLLVDRKLDIVEKTKCTLRCFRLFQTKMKCAILAVIFSVIMVIDAKPQGLVHERVRRFCVFIPF